MKRSRNAPSSYHIDHSAPPREWSPLAHHGHTMCCVHRAVCVNLPAELFKPQHKSLSDVLSCDEIEPDLALSALRELAAMLLHSHKDVRKNPTGKRRPSDRLDAREDVARHTFEPNVVDRDGEPRQTLSERHTFLLEEIRSGGEKPTLIGVRLWKMFIDPDWKESRSVGLLMEDGRGTETPRTPTELLALYKRVGMDWRLGLIDSFEEWLEMHANSGNWATRSLLYRDKAWSPHPLSFELVLDGERSHALCAGFKERKPTIMPPQTQPSRYHRWMAAIPQKVALRAGAGGEHETVSGEGGNGGGVGGGEDKGERGEKRETKAPSAQARTEMGALPMRFPSRVVVHGIPPLACARVALLPEGLVEGLCGGG